MVHEGEAAAEQRDADEDGAVEPGDALELAVVELHGLLHCQVPHAEDDAQEQRDDDISPAGGIAILPDEGEDEEDVPGGEGVEAGEGVDVVLLRVDPFEVQPDVAEQAAEQADDKERRELRVGGSRGEEGPGDGGDRHEQDRDGRFDHSGFGRLLLHALVEEPAEVQCAED